MIKNYIKIAWRNLKRKKASAMINLTGLAIGLAAFLLIVYFVRYELSYDSFLPDADRIYRVTVRQEENNQTGMHSARTYAAVSPVLKAELPEVETAVRILAEECLLNYKPANTKFNNQKTYWADADFHKLFGLSFVTKGNLEMLAHPNHAIMSLSAAKRFFGNDWSGDRSPIGKTIWLNEGVSFMLQGVYNDLPRNSHMAADFIVSYSTLTSLIGPVMENAMPPTGNFDYNYIRLQAGVDPAKAAAAINRVLLNKIPDAPKQSINFHFDLQPVQSIHLTSNLADELRPNGNQIFVYALMVAALLILVIAWVNFINLSTARAMDRAREVGVRKTIGAEQKQLIAQFITEGFLYGIISAVISVLIVLAVIKPFQNIIGIHTPLFALSNLKLWTFFALVVLAGSLLSSIYPAFVLSSFRPVKVLKGKLNAVSGGSGLFRKSLITLQFFTAILLLCGTGAIYFQVNYMKEQPLGMDTGAVLVIHTPRSKIGSKGRIDFFKTFRTEALKDPAVKTVGSSGCLPGKEFLNHMEDVRQAGVETGKNISYDYASVDEGYLPVLGATILAGRNFSENRPEENSILINEKSVATLGFKNAADAINKRIKIKGGKEKEIIGVARDVHYKGLQNAVSPLLLNYGHDYEFGFFSVKINTAGMQGTIKRLQRVWNEIYPNDPFDTFFLDSFFNDQYNNELAFGRMFSAFAILGVFIACMGLFGLVSFTASQKQKEIAVRKILGAGITRIFMLVTGQYFKYILIALILAVPFSHYLISYWLSDFAYHFKVSWWMYLLPVILIGLVALIAVSGLSLKAALANPVRSLRTE
ncbi:MAG TPA: ABC transporter permease [Chitinophagaceae bacterium]